MIDLTLSRKEAVEMLDPVSGLRAGAHGLAFKIATGEEPTTEPGWQASTTLSEYDELDAIGKAAVRLMPAGFGGLLAGFALQLPLTPPSGLVAIPAAYLLACWVALVAYDPLMGVVELTAGDSP